MASAVNEGYYPRSSEINQDSRSQNQTDTRVQKIRNEINLSQSDNNHINRINSSFYIDRSELTSLDEIVTFILIKLKNSSSLSFTATEIVINNSEVPSNSLLNKKSPTIVFDIFHQYFLESNERNPSSITTEIERCLDGTGGKALTDRINNIITRVYYAPMVYFLDLLKKDIPFINQSIKNQARTVYINNPIAANIIDNYLYNSQKFEKFRKLLIEICEDKIELSAKNSTTEAPNEERIFSSLKHELEVFDHNYIKHLIKKKYPNQNRRIQ